MSEKRYWECSKQKCKWRGTEEEKKKVQDTEHSFLIHHFCPKCGNDSFYELTEKQIKNHLKKKAAEAKFTPENFTRQQATGFIVGQLVLVLIEKGIPEEKAKGMAYPMLKKAAGTL